MAVSAPKVFAITLLFSVAACGRSTPAVSPGPAVAPVGAVAAQVLSPDIIGTSDRLAVRIVGVGWQPGRMVFELAQSSYVTIISVTDVAIEAVMPIDGVKQRMMDGGFHLVGLSQLESARFGVVDRFGARSGVLEDHVSAAEVQEYNRCVASARQAEAQRRQAQRPVVGRDSAGRPIYGAAPPPADLREESERYCRIPGQRNAPAASLAPAPRKNRYLLLYTSDMPTTYHEIVVLTISEGDPRSITEVIGRRLFGARGAQWSGSFVPW